MSHDFEIAINKPADIIAAIPAILRYTPTQSLVILMFKSDARSRHRLIFVARADLTAAHTADLVAECVLRGAQGVHVDSAVVVVVDDVGTDGTSPPRRDLVHAVAGALGAIASVGEALWTPAIRQGAPWCSYIDDESGQLPDPTTSPLAAATVHKGYIIFDSRDELTAIVRPNTDSTVIQRRARLARDIHQAQIAARKADHQEFVNTAMKTVRTAVESARSGTLPTGDHSIVHLAVLIADPAIRDRWLVGLLSDRTSAPEQLWAELVREAPPGLRVGPACLLAAYAYARGDGVVANVAVAAALRDDPGSVFADVLQTLLQTMTSPQVFRDLVSIAAAKIQ